MKWRHDVTRGIAAALASGAAMLLLGSAEPPDRERVMAPAAIPALPPAVVEAAPAPPQPVVPQPVEPPPPPPPPPPPTPIKALEEGVLIVVSIPSQKLFVFEQGEAWEPAKVSTGRRGKETPAGVFPILQKKVHHRSNLYDDAPMPYMQRLTWDGIALHAGYVPGYPASHGCIRLPKSFARKLYEATDFTSTIVLVTEEEIASADEARQLV